MPAKDSTALKDDVAETVGDIGSELRTLKDDVALLAQQITRLATVSGGEAYTGAKRQARRARKDIDHAVAGATEAAQDAAEDLTEALEDAVNRRPIVALAIALGVGFVMGAVWRR